MSTLSRGSAFRVEAMPVLLYLSLAMALTWPLAVHFADAISLGTETSPTVPLFNLWTLGWNVDRLVHLYQGYWDAPIFHPTPGAFAFSEPQPVTGLVASPFWAVGGPAVAYNSVVVLALFLNGWLGFHLLGTVGLARAPALAGGVLVETLPFVAQELGVLQLISLAGFLWALASAVALGREPTPRRGVVLGLALAVTAGTCGYYAVFLGLVLAVGGFWLLPRWRERRTWTSLGVAAAVAGIMVLPLVLGQLRPSDQTRLTRSEKTVAKHAARPAQYLAAAWPRTVPLPGVTTAERPGTRAFYPGTVQVLLAVGGLFWGSRRSRRFRAFCCTMGVVGFVLSLGPHFDLGPLSPYGVLAAVFPGYDQLRSLFRFAVVVQLAVAFLAAVGLQALFDLPRPGAVVKTAAVLVLGALAGLEQWPGPQGLQPLPALEGDMPWLRFIETETAPDDVFAFVPLPRDSTSAAYRGTAQWMYWALRHGRPMVNGYSGFFPRRFRELKEAMKSFPDSPSLERLRAHGVRYCVVLRDFAERAELEAASAGGLVHVFADDANRLDVYVLR